jgi:hypothetical protein
MTNDKVQNPNDNSALVAWFHWFDWLRMESSNANGLVPISLERTLKNFWEPFLVKRNGHKSRV